MSFDLEITARCNNNCRHCYINLDPGDRKAQALELSFEEIDRIAEEAVSMGALWCLLTGGEPLLRKDFSDIYLHLKKKGLLISVFTNANLITEEHIRLFKSYPPRDIEVSVYGVTEKTYEKVTRKKGSFRSFQRGLDLLLKNGIKVRFKAMALRSNVHELPEIARFCRERTKDFFRFDPFIHLRYDRDEQRNREIISERLSPEEIVALEKADPERIEFLEKNCSNFIVPEFETSESNRLFLCGAGLEGFTLGYDGMLRLCSPLFHPDCLYDLRKGSLRDAWYRFIPEVRALASDDPLFDKTCRVCSLKNLCMYCPAVGYLETGRMDRPVDYFCRLAGQRAGLLKSLKKA